MDKEEVIKDLEEYRDREFVKEGITFFDADPRYRKLIINNALALLKEQEAVKPYVTGRGESFETAETWWYACGNCHEALDPNDKYCRHCGTPVKWD